MKKRMMSLISLALVGAMILPNAVIADEAAADEGKVLNWLHKEDERLW